MSRPIAETPILKGNEAREFEKNLKLAEKKRVSEPVLSRILESHKRMQALYVKK